MKHVLYLLFPALLLICPPVCSQNQAPRNPFVPRTRPIEEAPKQKEDTTDRSQSSRKRDFAHAIDMLGFEKRLNDRTETFMLQNNTENLVTRVKLKITYKTPTGRMIDYREVIIEGEILPHTTRQFETESFDKGKRYYYHKSIGGNKKLEGYPFHIQFSLLRYDIAITE